MNEQVQEIINKVFESYNQELENEYLEDQAIEKIKAEIENKVLIIVQEDLKIDTLVNPDKSLIKEIREEINEQVKNILANKKQEDEEPEIDTTNLSISEIISILQKEAKDTKNNDQKGNRRKATAKSGRLIKKIKKEIKKIKDEEDVDAKDLEVLEQLEVLLDEQLEWHKEQLTDRYKKEFRKKPATVKAIFTVLPKGIKIQAERVIHCIKQIKEAKTNKERIFKVLELGKQIGLLVATPVIFTVKFIVKHWYLLLLLLLLLRLPNFNWGKEKQPQDNKEPQMEYEPEYAYETDPALNPLVGEEPELAPANQPESIPVQEPTHNPVYADDLSADALRREQLEIRHSQQPVTNPVVESTPVVAPETNAVADAITNSEVVQGVEQTVQTQMSVDDFYETITQVLKSSYPESEIFRTYEEARDYLVKYGCSLQEAEIALSGGYDGAFSYIKWISGPGGVFESSDELLRAYESGNEAIKNGVDNYVQANQAQLDALLQRQASSSNIIDFVKNLTGAELTLFLIYEALQYGLAIPTGGLSLLAPG